MGGLAASFRCSAYLRREGEIIVPKREGGRGRPAGCSCRSLEDMTCRSECESPTCRKCADIRAARHFPPQVRLALCTLWPRMGWEWQIPRSKATFTFTSKKNGQTAGSNINAGPSYEGLLPQSPHMLDNAVLLALLRAVQRSPFHQLIDAPSPLPPACRCCPACAAARPPVAAETPRGSATAPLQERLMRGGGGRETGK